MIRSAMRKLLQGKKFAHRQAGFTIIEAVVAAGVFAFVVSSSLGIYIATVGLDSKSRAERAVLQNARFIMDYLAKEVRNGKIDYSRQNDADTLSLINQLDEEITIQWGGAGNPVLTLTKNGVGATTLNSDDVRVTNMVFYVKPSINPFEIANDVHIQPHVTVGLQVESVVPRYSESSRLNMQSTFSVREYPSRF